MSLRLRLYQIQRAADPASHARLFLQEINPADRHMGVHSIRPRSKKKESMQIMRHLIAAVCLSLGFVAVPFAASLDGLEIHSTSVGAGPTIIFVHGWTCDDSSWRDQVPAFSDDYRVITLDLPGHGQSDLPADGIFSMALFADAVEAVRAEAGADEIVLVGHSMGGPVIRTYALNYPEHVAGLVAVDGQLDIRGFGFGGGAAAGFSISTEQRELMIRGMFIAETPEPLQEHILAMMLAAPEATASGAMGAMFDTSSHPQGVIEAPALAVIASTGQVPNLERTREVIPRFETAQVPGTGHFLMMEKPDEFNALLREFLAEIGFE
jgi:pimeloyl-ACP methyl ester carboxylesterase